MSQGRERSESFLGRPTGPSSRRVKTTATTTTKRRTRRRRGRMRRGRMWMKTRTTRPPVWLSAPKYPNGNPSMKILKSIDPLAGGGAHGFGNLINKKHSKVHNQ